MPVPLPKPVKCFFAATYWCEKIFSKLCVSFDLFGQIIFIKIHMVSSALPRMRKILWNGLFLLNFRLIGLYNLLSDFKFFIANLFKYLLIKQIAVDTIFRPSIFIKGFWSRLNFREKNHSISAFFKIIH